MKCFYILDNNNNQIYSLVYAKTAKSALKKYLKGMMTMGFYDIVNENGEFKIISSYGMNISAIICNYPEKLQEKQFLTIIK